MRCLSEIGVFSAPLSSPVSNLDFTLINMAGIRCLTLILIYLILSLLGRTMAKVTTYPNLSGSVAVTSTPSGHGTILVEATTCTASPCPDLREYRSGECNWREVTPLSVYKQADDPLLFGKVLPIAAKADTQGWHYPANQSACPDLVFQGAVREHGGMRVGCVCSFHGITSEHLLCSFDLQTKGHPVQPVEVTVNASACKKLSITTTELAGKTSHRRHTPTVRPVSTTANGTEGTEKFESINKLDVKLGYGLGIPTLVIILIIVYKYCILKVIRDFDQQRDWPSKNGEGQLRHLPGSPVTPGRSIVPVNCFTNHAASLTTVSLDKLENVKGADPKQDPLLKSHVDKPEVNPAVTLLKAKTYISENVKLGNIPEELLDKGILSKSDYEEVVTQNKERGRGRAMETLIDILSHPEHQNDVVCFVNLLDMTEKDKQELFGSLLKPVNGNDTFEARISTHGTDV